MLRHACGYALANKGIDTRTLQAYLGHRSINSTTRYAALAPGRFKNIWGGGSPSWQSVITNPSGRTITGAGRDESQQAGGHSFLLRQFSLPAAAALTLQG